MDSGEIVYRPLVGSFIDDEGLLVTVAVGTVTSIVVDGQPLVRDEDGRLTPGREWHQTSTDAVRAARGLLATRVSVLRAQLDRLHGGQS